MNEPGEIVWCMMVMEHLVHISHIEAHIPSFTRTTYIMLLNTSIDINIFECLNLLLSVGQPHTTAVIQVFLFGQMMEAVQYCRRCGNSCRSPTNPIINWTANEWPNLAFSCVEVLRSGYQNQWQRVFLVGSMNAFSSRWWNGVRLKIDQHYRI